MFCGPTEKFCDILYLKLQAASQLAAKVLSVSVCRGLRHYGVYDCAALHR